jgi:transcriptional antiterminator NusG
MAKQFYVLRVASNKEEQVRDTLNQKVKLEGLGEGGLNIVGRILVPMEEVIKTVATAGGKNTRRAKYDRKLYPGYVFVEMEMRPDGTVPEQVWFLFKETAGVGDFISSGTEKDRAGKPIPMPQADVDKMLAVFNKEPGKPTMPADIFKEGQQVKIKEGPFANFEGEISEVIPVKEAVKVTVTIFGRKTPLELNYWQVEPM